MSSIFKFYDRGNGLILLPNDTEKAKVKIKDLLDRGAVRKIILETGDYVQVVLKNEFRENIGL